MNIRDEATLFFFPLIETGLTPVGAKRLLELLGMNPDDAAADEFNEAILDLLRTVEQLPDDPNSTDAQVIRQLALLVLSALTTRSLNGQLIERLSAYLLAQYLDARQPALYAALKATGVVDHNQQDVVMVHWERFQLLLSEPSSWAREVLGWGDQNDPHRFQQRLGDHLGNLLFALDLTTSYDGSLTPTSAAMLGVSADEQATYLPIIQDQFDPSLASVDSELLFPYAIEAGVKLLPFSGGIALSPYARSRFKAKLTDDVWNFEVQTTLGESDGPVVGIDPNGFHQLSAGRADATLTATLTSKADEQEPRSTLISVPGLGAVTTAGPAVGVTWTEQGNPAVMFYLQEVILEIAVAKDGLLAAVLPTEQSLKVGDLGIRWSADSGVSLLGGGALEVKRDFNVDTGLAVFRSVSVRLDVDANKLLLTTDVDVNLGPVKLALGGLGLQFSSQSLDPTDEQFLLPTFTFPNRIGVSVNAGVVQGGGFLSVGVGEGSYIGALELEIGNIGVTAVGLLNTQLPNGEDGYSLVVIISGQFPPVQLGFGFTLNALGGLIGINRSTDTDALKSGLRRQALDSIMFPSNPVENASRIVADIGGIFIPTQGQHILGPMAVLQWGTPPILRAEVGILLELDSPLRLIVLGQLALGFPSLEVEPKLVEINLDVLGIIDFDREELTLDAVLFDSRIAAFELSGEMALRMRWGARPFFVLSIGGVHPAFERPPSLPDLQRLSLSLGSGNNPRVRLETYLCLTSNTIQVGAEVDVYAAAMGFNVSGQLGFDALFELEPFRFEANLRASVALRRGRTNILSVKLVVNLSGPTPWVVDGKATATLFFFDITVPVRLTFGAANQPRLPSGDPWGALREALARNENWKNVLLPADERLIVTRDSPGIGAMVHPAARLEVRQTILPFGIALGRFGNLDPGDDRFFTISEVRIGLGDKSLVFDESSASVVREYFAAGQYFELSDDERLSAPSFERLPAGAGGFGSDTYNAPANGDLQRRHKSIRQITSYIREGEADIETQTREEEFLNATSLDTSLMEAAAMFGAAGEAHNKTDNDAAPIPAFYLEDPHYVIAAADTLTALRSDQQTEGFAAVPELGHEGAKTHAGARVALTAHLGRHPDDADRLLIVGTHELLAA